MKHLNLRFISGAVNTILGIIGYYAVLFMASPAVTWPFIVVGAIAFVVMFGYGLYRAAAAAMIQADFDFQINN